MANKAKEHIGFHYLLAKIRLCVLIHRIILLRQTQDNNSIMCGFYSIIKTYFFQMITRIDKIIYTHLLSKDKKNMADER